MNDTKKRESGVLGDTVTAADFPSETKAANLERRRTLIAGLIAAPAVMTLMSRSAWGSNQRAFYCPSDYGSVGGTKQTIDQVGSIVKTPKCDSQGNPL